MATEQLEHSNMENIIRFANSDEGRKLMEMLRQGLGSQWEDSVQQAKSGNTKELTERIRELLNTPEGNSIRRQIEGR